MNYCHLCEARADKHITIKVGVYHESGDQRDTTRLNIIPLCQRHFDEVMTVLKVYV